jgi:predicted transcriptional regulator
MPENARDKLSAAEIAVMKAVWRTDPATVPAILDTVNAQRDGEALTRGTIHVLLTRLEEKGWLEREKDGRGFVYRGTVDEATGLAEVAGEFRETVFDGSSLALVQCLARGGKIKPKEVASLRLLLDELEAKQTRSKTKP